MPLSLSSKLGTLETEYRLSLSTSLTAFTLQRRELRSEKSVNLRKRLDGYLSPRPSESTTNDFYIPTNG